MLHQRGGKGADTQISGYPLFEISQNFSNSRFIREGGGYADFGFTPGSKIQEGMRGSAKT